jgi:hypothetical protein
MPVKDIRQGGPLSEARGTVITLPFGQPEAQEFEAMLERAVKANTFDGRVAASETWAVATLRGARMVCARAAVPVYRNTKAPRDGAGRACRLRFSSVWADVYGRRA